ncbi:MAG TPA: DNA repair protein RadA [Flavobacteriales bacterium]|jgi:DNA repair protein RadA/Sms|nr:DNA repair protein RadA [Flavobacteriales bacterium]
MSKVRKAFFCQNCGNESPKWVGKCPACGEWNTYVEEIIQKENKSSSLVTHSEENKRPRLLSDLAVQPNHRISISDPELNRVLGGGLVPGSVTLVGGEPGIGKSTLMLQLALSSLKNVLYVSGEESGEQIKMRADRLKISSETCFILTDVSLDAIVNEANKLMPGVLIIDSIQTLSTPALDAAPGSITQIRACTAELTRFAKTRNTPVFIIGHINKDGQIAGPKVMEHMVDTVLQFEGDRNHMFRMLRSVKNRFGSTNELGIYEMGTNGLQAVENPSSILVQSEGQRLSGRSVGVIIEGIRPLLIESQALVGTSAYGTPQRSATGFDQRRMNMLLAVLEKKQGIKLSQKDVFLNITGGIRVQDPALDLAITAAIVSSMQDIAITEKLAFIGEIGLSGEVRPVPRIEQRIEEAKKLGYDKVICPDIHGSQKSNIEIVPVRTIRDALRHIFG